MPSGLLPSAVVDTPRAAGAAVPVTPTRPLVPLSVPGAAGFCGALCVLLGVAQPGSPFVVQAPGAWFFGSAGAAPAPSADARFLWMMLVYVGIALMIASWFETVRTVRARPGTPLRSLVGMLIAWSVPVSLTAPLFSGDVYSYAAQGQLVARGINPFVHGPSALGRGSFLRLVDPLWRHAPAPYGPAWERLSAGIVEISGHDVLGAVIGFRLVALVGVTLVAWGVPALARSVGRDGSTAFALAVLNPLVLLGLLGGAHNDALMLGLLVAGCALARRRHVVVGLVLCALAAEVKIPALVGAAFIGWWWAGGRATSRLRLARVAAAVVAAAAVMAIISAGSMLGWRWVGDLSNAGTVVSWLDPATAIGLALGHAAHALGYVGHSLGFVTGARAAGLVAASIVSLVLLVRSREAGEIGALGWSLLAFALLGPVVWPWYESWGIVFLAVVAERWVLRLVLVLSAVAGVADVPKPGLLINGNPLLVSLCWAVLGAALCVFLVARVVPRPPSTPLPSRAPLP